MRETVISTSSTGSVSGTKQKRKAERKSKISLQPLVTTGKELAKFTKNVNPFAMNPKELDRKQMEAVKDMFIALVGHKDNIKYLSPGQMDHNNYALYKRVWKAFGWHRRSYRIGIETMLAKYDNEIRDIFGRRITPDEIYFNVCVKNYDAYLCKLFEIFAENKFDLLSMHKLRIWKNETSYAQLIRSVGLPYKKVFNLMAEKYKEQIKGKLGREITYGDVRIVYKAVKTEQKKKEYLAKLFGVLMNRKSPASLAPGNMLWSNHIYSTIMNSGIWGKNSYPKALAEMFAEYKGDIKIIFGRELTTEDVYKRNRI